MTLDNIRDPIVHHRIAVCHDEGSVTLRRLGEDAFIPHHIPSPSANELQPEQYTQ